MLRAPCRGAGGNQNWKGLDGSGPEGGGVRPRLGRGGSVLRREGGTPRVRRALRRHRRPVTGEGAGAGPGIGAGVARPERPRLRVREADARPPVAVHVLGVLPPAGAHRAGEHDDGRGGGVGGVADLLGREGEEQDGDGGELAGAGAGEPPGEAAGEGAREPERPAEGADGARVEGGEGRAHDVTSSALSAMTAPLTTAATPSGERSYREAR